MERAEVLQRLEEFLGRDDIKDYSYSLFRELAYAGTIHAKEDPEDKFIRFDLEESMNPEIGYTGRVSFESFGWELGRRILNLTHRIIPSRALEIKTFFEKCQRENKERIRKEQLRENLEKSLLAACGRDEVKKDRDDFYYHIRTDKGATASFYVSDYPVIRNCEYHVNFHHVSLTYEQAMVLLKMMRQNEYIPEEDELTSIQTS